MKRIILPALVIFSLSINVRAQQQNLPADIQEYYKAKDFLSLYSLKSEREMINVMNLRGKSLAALKNYRLQDIAGLLIAMNNRYYRPLNAKDERSGIDFELILPSVYRITSWNWEGNQITVKIRTYYIGDLYNQALVASYKTGITPENFKGPDYSKISDKFQQEVHYWLLDNGRWTKASVNIVLTK